MSSLFKKPKRNFRQRTKNTHDSDNEDDEHKNTLQVSNVKTTQKKHRESVSKNSAGKNAVKAAPKLSFHDEEEGETEVFKVKKSSFSRKLSKLKSKDKKTKNKQTRNSADDDTQETEHDGFVVKHTLGNVDRSNYSVVRKESNNNKRDVLSSGDEYENNEPSKPDDPVRKALECGAIPDAAMIHAARKQRQLASEQSAGATRDFLSLDDADKNDSRLIRDDEDDVSDEEEEGRISFSVDHQEIKRAKVLEAYLSEQRRGNSSEEEHERDEELDRWEAEQIRKGVSSISQVQLDDRYNSGTTHGLYSYEDKQVPSYNTCRPEKPLIKVMLDKINERTFKPPSKPLKEITTLMVKTRLEDRLQSLQEVYRGHQMEEDKLQDELIESETIISELDGSGPSIGVKFNFYQEMRGYVTDLVECLNNKIVVINTIEDRMHSLLADRALRLAKRRQMDCRDQAEEYSVYANKSFTKLPTNIDPEKQRRMTEREGRRIRRRRNRETNLSVGLKHNEGLSSDDEEERTDVNKFNSTMESILNESEEVFEDVNEDFASIFTLKSWFEKWKSQQPESYEEAYIPLCLPKLFGPYVRLELLSWNPLEQVRNIETYPWYRLLLTYGDDGKSNPDDPDIDLLPMIIEKIVVPKVTDLVSRVWDPMSSSQTSRLVTIVTRLTEDYPTLTDTSKPTMKFLKSIVDRIKKCLEDDVFIPLYTRQLLENRLFNGVTFFHRQLWSCIKLLKNILKWDGLIAEQPLQELSINGLLNRYMILGLQNSPVNYETLEKAKTIVSAFPSSWFSKLSGNNTIPQLSMFCRYLKNSAESAGSEKAANVVSEIASEKDYLKEIMKILVSIGDKEMAQSISGQFSVF